MYPIICRVGPVTIYSYGLMLALAFIFAGIVAYLELKRRGLDQEIVYDLVILAAVGGIIGGRIFYVIGHWEDYREDWLQIFSLPSGGLIFYGGVLGGALAVLIYVKRRGLHVRQIADVTAPALAIGAAIGRIGCLLRGCCYGKVTNLPWGIEYLDLVRHPTQIYEIFMNLAIFAILWFWRRRSAYDGQLFIIYLLLYSFARFVVEFFRVTIPVYFGLSGSQIISIVIFILAIAILAYKSISSQNREISR